jgi:hypothetical protein
LPSGIEDRNADVWEPLIAIADELGGAWPNTAREAAVALVAASKEREPSLGVRLLTDLRTVFGDSEHMPTSVILQALHDIEEAPWGNMKGQPLNSRGLSQRLLQYGIKPKTIRVGTGTPKGYARADLHEAWLRYLPSQSPDKSATSATCATRPINVNESNAIGVADNVADLLTVADRAATPNLAATKEPKQNQYSISDVADVADVADFTADGGACSHCGGVGGTVEVSVGGEMSWLHYGCIKEWEARR